MASFHPCPPQFPFSLLASVLVEGNQNQGLKKPLTSVYGFSHPVASPNSFMKDFLFSQS